MPARAERLILTGQVTEQSILYMDLFKALFKDSDPIPRRQLRRLITG
jgi:hypothetical protein